MKLRKLEWWEDPRQRKSKVPNLVVLPTKTTEVRTEPAPMPDMEALLKPLKDDVEKLKKRRPEILGGVGQVGSYHQVTSSEVRFTEASFFPGINVIGVASNVATTIWLPNRLEPNHLIAIKDELGVADTYPITVYVSP